ncbi:unnamed protein product [Urochloa decumbens]|uniref:Disease resistance protein At4g27190-like leucine-rich repeats domain-containing protein n=1 Tax=Urochloa decumbens TaxID=240449 RepID=A0ABC9APW4_9POAL
MLPVRTATSSRHNVIYFDGWDGLGASAVLWEVGRRLTTDGEFSHIIHINCSKWESRRATQRALAKQLQLPHHVMQMFDAQDEDDYNGVGQGSRLEIPKVAREIYQHVQKQLSRRFLVIFNNGSCEEIDLESFGFPLSGYSWNKLLWSFQGGFRLYPKTEADRALESTRKTDVLLLASSSNLSEDNFSGILRHEAGEVARGITSIGGIDWTAAAANSFVYTMRLCGMGGQYDLATHGCNYWRCDGVIQLQQGDEDAGADDTLWLSCDAMEREMQLDADYHQRLPSPSLVARRLHGRIASWTSPSYGSMLIPPDQHGHIPKAMFQQYDKLCVLKLSACAFSLQSPPFICCHSLRFLWLDHCRDDESSRNRVGNQLEDSRQFFQRLWVLDSRANGVWFSASANDKMELLDFSGNSGYKGLYVRSSCNNLETVIIDGSSALEVISFNGCAKLKNLLLSGLFPQLYSLDITGTAVKTLDLGAMEAPKLDSLFLHDCGKLCAILWPPQDRRKRYLGKLRIGTTRKDGSIIVAADRIGRTPAEFAWRIPARVEFDWYISARDARLLGSLVPVKDYFGPNIVGMEISTTTLLRPSRLRVNTAGGNRDVSAGLKDTDMHQQAVEGDDDVWAIMWACPAPPRLQYDDCYTHIEDQMTRAKFQASITVPGFMCDNAKILHVHNSMMVYGISLPSSSKMAWESLETLEIMWCGDLVGIIEDYTGRSRVIFIGFPRLKHIHLHELPMLRRILNIPRFPIFAPYLETVKIRGCWGLKTLPFDVGGGKNQVDCDCEKEWWNGLKWLSREHASPYKPIHPRHYKKTMLRGSFLR